MTLKFILSFLSLVLMLGGLVLLATAQERDVSKWTWQHSDDGWRRMVRIVGRAEFDEDYTDVQSLLDADGSFRVEEERGGETRRYEVRRGADGALLRTYKVNGEMRALDADARAWRAGMMLLAVRQGLDAQTRIARLLAKRGPDAVLAEIAQIEGDYPRRIYFDALLKNSNLNHALLQKALREAGRGIKSDYERAQLLHHYAGTYLRADDLVPVYFEVLDRIASDYERRRVMSAALGQAPLSHTARRRLLTSAAALSSDYEKATLLISAAPAYVGDASLRTAFEETVNTIGSDYERGRVRNAVAKRAGSN